MKVMRLFAAAGCAAAICASSASAAPIVGTQSLGIEEVLFNSVTIAQATEIQLGPASIIGGTQDFPTSSSELLSSTALQLVTAPQFGGGLSTALAAPYLLGVGSQWGRFTGFSVLFDSAASIAPGNGFSGGGFLVPIRFSGGNETFQPNPSSGNVTLTQRSLLLGGIFEPGGTAFEPNNATLQIDFDGNAVQAILRTSGAASLPVPEPGTLALLALGIGSAVFARRRQ